MNIRIKAAGIVFISLVFFLAISTDSSAAQNRPQTQVAMVKRVSIASDGMQGNGMSSNPFISDDEHYVVFTSYASNLVDGDTNTHTDAFVHDLLTGETRRVSVASDGTQGNDQSFSGSLSADGHFVVFNSWADNLVPGDTNYLSDVFVRDMLSGQTTLVSLDSNGVKGNGWSRGSSLSADGRFVAFTSNSTNLVEGDTNPFDDVYVHDRSTGQTTRVSVASDGTQSNNHSWGSSISADGRYVVFVSNASNLVAGDTNGTRDTFVHDRETGETTRVSVTSDGIQANAASLSASISADGRYVVFDSFASNLVVGDTNQTNDIFVHDRLTGETTRVSVANNGTEGDGYSGGPSISADGQFVAFQSDASNLVVGDTNGTSDIFLHNRVTHETSRVSITSHGGQGNAGCFASAISATGRYVAFNSDASNLVTGDTNFLFDVFLRDMEGVSIPGIDFYPHLDGYGFGNDSGGNLGNFTESDAQRMFGDEAVCSSFYTSQCRFDRQAMLWSTYADRSLLSGRSDGMASTSMRFFKSLDTHPWIDYTYLLGPEDEVLTTWQGESITTTVQSNIAFFSVEGLLPPVQDYKELIRQDNPTQILTETISVLSNGAPDPLILFIRPTINSAGHTVTPYGYTNQG
ncbi:MAG: hypothetical protein A2Z71_01595, partial [Chloroflexi bacterium RBG_13_50_21]